MDANDVWKNRELNKFICKTVFDSISATLSERILQLTLDLTNVDFCQVNGLLTGGFINHI